MTTTTETPAAQMPTAAPRESDTGRTGTGRTDAGPADAGRADTGTRPVRVLEVAAEFLPNLGGVEAHTNEVTRRLATRDEFDLTVFATDRDGAYPRSERMDGFGVVRRRAWPRGRDWYLSPGLPGVIRRGGWDVVHFQGVHTFVPIVGMAAARAAGIPYLLTFHSGGSSHGWRNAIRGTQWKAISPLLRDADRLVAVSRFERGLFEGATGIGADHFTVIRNGGSLPEVPGDVEVVPDRVLTVGRLERYKGHHRAIEMLPALRRRRPAAVLRVLGGGPYEPELRALVERLGLGAVVQFASVPVGDRAAMARELASAAAVVALSEYEAHPVAVMEAVVVGVPVVGFDVAGIGDLVEDGMVAGVPPTAGADEVAARLDAVMTATAGAPRVPPADLPTWEQSADALGELYLRAAGR